MKSKFVRCFARTSATWNRHLCSASKQSHFNSTKSDHLYSSLQNADLFVIAGLNVIQDQQETRDIASELRSIFEDLQLPFIFKASFDKANRTSLTSFRGVGAEKGLQILQDIHDDFQVPVLTDVHCSHTIQLASEYPGIDVLQIPAFLCRQTDLLVDAAKTNRIIHVKKGQFATADVIWESALKIIHSGNPKVMLCDRGFSFGYQDLVVDSVMTRTMILLGAKHRVPVTLDVSHALQRPGSKRNERGELCSAGKREFVPTLARMGVAVGCRGVFIEVFPEPSQAPVDSHVQWPLRFVKPLFQELKQIAGSTRARSTDYLG